MTQISQRDTTRDEKSSPDDDLIGRRVAVGSFDGLTYTEHYGAIVVTGGAEHFVRLETDGKVRTYPRDRVRLVNSPHPLAGDDAAVRAAARWIARSRGQLHILEARSYNDSAYKATLDGARDLCAEIDAERARRGPCQYVWRLGVQLYGCMFLTEPGEQTCGVHWPIVAQYGWTVDVPRHVPRIPAEPAGNHDPLRVLGLAP